MLSVDGARVESEIVRGLSSKLDRYAFPQGNRLKTRSDIPPQDLSEDKLVRRFFLSAESTGQCGQSLDHAFFLRDIPATPYQGA
jgi:hypothetical protein